MNDYNKMLRGIGAVALNNGKEEVAVNAIKAASHNHLLAMKHLQGGVVPSKG